MTFSMILSKRDSLLIVCIIKKNQIRLMDKKERTRCCTNFLIETPVRWFERSLLIELTTMKRRAASARWYLAARLGSSPAIVERKSRIGGVGLDQSSRYAPPTVSAVLLSGVSCVGVETGAASSFLPYPSVWFDIMTPVNHPPL